MKMVFLSLIFILLVDMSFVLTKDFLPDSYISSFDKIIIFIISSYLSLFFQYVLLKKLFTKSKLLNSKNNTIIYNISKIGLLVIGFLVSILIYQMVINNSYNKFLLIVTISSCYVIPIVILTRLLLLFNSWYKLRGTNIIILNIISVSLIIINLSIAFVSTDLIVHKSSTNIREYIGGKVVISSEKDFLNNLIQIFSTTSFLSLWITTVVLMYNYQDRKVKKIIFWIIISLPIIYNLISYFYQFILVDLLTYWDVDSTFISIAYNSFLTISGPMEGLAFVILFLKLSGNFKHYKNLHFYITLTAFGILLLFTANQSKVLNETPYPPFGLITITMLNTASILMLIGIYNSAFLISINKSILETIYKHSTQSKLLGIIGQAEKIREINKIVKNIVNNVVVEENNYAEIEKDQLREYVEGVLKELNKDKDKK